MPNIKVLSQYIKDLSFEVPNSPNVFLKEQAKPEIAVTIDIDAQKINDTLYEVTLKIIADAQADDEKVFICEVAYSGIFSVENIGDNDIEQILVVYCPNLLFPFARRIIANNTIDSGFPPLMINPIDFGDLFQRRKEQEAQTMNETTN